MIKSPLNYVGGKYKLLPQILPLFPDRIRTFYDVFGGGGNVSLNVAVDEVIYNDLNVRVVQILEAFNKYETSALLSHIDSRIAEYQLSKTNAEGFLKLREYYNTHDRNPLDLYTLICYAFNYQIRFNSKGEYNMPFGKDRSSFNESLRQKFIAFCDKLHSLDIQFTNSDFREYADLSFAEGDFVYCDPPYLNSTACYNERDGWTEKDERDLYSFLEALPVKWALSNNLATNPLLGEWTQDKGYKINYLSNSYGNASYHKKDKSAKDMEVLITNY